MFITAADMATHMYPGISNAISHGDETFMEFAIASAIGEAQGYCSRFKIDFIFGAIGTERDATLLQHVKNIAKWHFIGLATPEIDYEDAETRYNNAIAWLKNIQMGKVVPYGWPPAVEPKYAADLARITSNPKRRNHY